MRKRLCIFLILSICLMSLFADESSEYVIRKVKWGYTPDQVQQAEKMPGKFGSYETDAFLEYTVKFGDNTAILNYFFIPLYGLVGIDYFIECSTALKAENFQKKVLEKLLSKYGESTETEPLRYSIETQSTLIQAFFADTKDSGPLYSGMSYRSKQALNTELEL